MKNRDEELDEIEAELKTPFIQRPEHLDGGNGTLCWLDGSRRCGSDCVAFDPEEGLDDRGQEIDSPEKCRVLGYMKQNAGAAVAVATIGRVRAQDKARPEAPPVPPVGGRKER